ncbi:hypothetical protein RSW44_25400, partial [Escherichia coli]|uniref:hypothetical protein n=1 Tax=Escherichia coli TaxID=562 RepID=UPI0028DFC847|nr:hypothetical protein [Escherichia coli]
MFLMPTLMLFLYGYAIRLDIMEAPIGVLQESHDLASDELVAQSRGSPAFQVVRNFTGRHELSQSIEKGEVWAGIVVPRT